MGDTSINGNNATNAATVTNATDGSGTPSQNPNDVTVVTSNASVFGSGAYFDVTFLGGNDYLLAQNVPWANPDTGSEVGFDRLTWAQATMRSTLSALRFGIWRWARACPSSGFLGPKAA